MARLRRSSMGHPRSLFLLLLLISSHVISPASASASTSSLRGSPQRTLEEEEPQSDTTTTLITDWTFKPLIKECLSELPDNPTACDKLARWDISRITDCSLLFWEALNPDSHEYKISPGAELFNVDLSEWDTSSCTTTKSMFHGATAFDQPIGQWNVEKVVDMSHMFQGATRFNQDISKWKTGNVTNMSHMFRYASHFHNDRLDWDVSKVQQFSYMFLDTDAFNGQINDWNVEAATDKNNHFAFVAMFDGARAFNQPLGNWDVRNVEKFSFMFQKALAFNQDLSDWDVGQAVDFTGMFHGARSLNQTLCWTINADAKREKILEGAVEESQIDGNTSCFVEKEKLKTFPPLPTGNGAAGVWAPAGEASSSATESSKPDNNIINEEKEKEEETNEQSHKDNNVDNNSTDDDDADQGVRWELVGIVLAVLAVLVLAVRMRQNKSLFGAFAYEDEVFLDQGDQDLFQQEHGGNQQQMDRSGSRKRAQSPERFHDEGEIDYTPQGPIDIFSETFTPQQHQNDDQGHAVDAMEAIRQIEEATGSSFRDQLGGSARSLGGESTQSLGESTRSNGGGGSRPKLREKLQKSLSSRGDALQRRMSQRSQHKIRRAMEKQRNKGKKAADYGDGDKDGEISFDADQGETTVGWGQTFSKSFEEGDRDDMPLEQAVSALETIIQLDKSMQENQQRQSQISGEVPLIQFEDTATTTVARSNPSIFRRSVDVDEMKDTFDAHSRCSTDSFVDC